jgi:hypothetical protein
MTVTYFTIQPIQKEHDIMNNPLLKNGLLALAGLALFIFGLTSLGSNSKEWPSVQGQITSSMEETNQSGNTSYQISYSYQVKGVEYDGTFTSSDKREPGEAITIYYDPADPSTDILSPGEREWQVWGAILVGLAMLGWGGWEIIKLQRKQQGG